MPHSPPTWLQHLRGQFIVFDGPDGCGKTTQLDRFVQFTEMNGLSVCAVRDPGGTEVGNQIRQLLLTPPHQEEMDVRCEMLLFMASRAQLVTKRIKPALDAGKVVLADRFVSSTLAYQGAAGGLPQEDILEVSRVAFGNCLPRLFIIFDVDTDTASARLAASPPKTTPPLEFDVDGGTLCPDRIEARGSNYQKAVRQGYLNQAAADPDHYLIINASADADAVFTKLLESLESKSAMF